LTRAQPWITDKAFERRITMAESQSSQLITYVDSSEAEWQEFRPGSRRKVLYEDPQTGQLTMLVQWDAGYRMGAVEHHEYDEHLYIIAGTFVDEHRASGPGTYILNRAGSEHQAYTPDGCTFLEVVPGRLRQS
jgi:mannose-6-phosphate isomerase-like protein (cupin superfamily)